MQSNLKTKVESFLKEKCNDKDRALALFNEVKEALEKGQVRTAEKIDGIWQVNYWVKTAILLGFKHGIIEETEGFCCKFYDKNTLSLHKFSLQDNVRIAPGGSSIRSGSFIAQGTIIMPPSFINIGAYIDTGCLIDSHALVGSSAQIGKNVHISSAAQIGGVLEPIGAMPVIIEDNVFIGGNCGIYEGVIIKTNAVIGSGVILNSSTPIFDNISGEFIRKTSERPLIVPEKAVVVAGSRPIKDGKGKDMGLNIYCPIIIKYRDTKTSKAVSLEEALRITLE